MGFDPLLSHINDEPARKRPRISNVNANKSLQCTNVRFADHNYCVEDKLSSASLPSKAISYDIDHLFDNIDLAAYLEDNFSFDEIDNLLHGNDQFIEDAIDAASNQCKSKNGDEKCIAINFLPSDIHSVALE